MPSQLHGGIEMVSSRMRRYVQPIKHTSLHSVAPLDANDAVAAQSPNGCYPWNSTSSPANLHSETHAHPSTHASDHRVVLSQCCSFCLGDGDILTGRKPMEGALGGSGAAGTAVHCGPGGH